MTRRFTAVLWAVVLAGALFACASGAGVRSGAAPSGDRDTIDRLVIEKARHRMRAYRGQALVATYGVSIGRGGAGPKRIQGDGKTPVGVYRIDAKYPSQQFLRFLSISYPNAADRRAFAEGKRKGSIPPSARIGGSIGIHGEKRGYAWLPHKWADWTQGCVAVDDDEIRFLYDAVKVGARVEIRP